MVRIVSCVFLAGELEEFLSVYRMCVQAMTLEDLSCRHIHDCQLTTFWHFSLFVCREF